MYVTSVLFLVRIDNFVLTMGFYLELHALTLVACFHALLYYMIRAAAYVTNHSTENNDVLDELAHCLALKEDPRDHSDDLL